MRLLGTGSAEYHFVEADPAKKNGEKSAILGLARASVGFFEREVAMEHPRRPAAFARP